MASEISFDIVSRVDLQEVRNAVSQAQKEIAQRFDFKGSKTEIRFDEKETSITLVSDDDFKLQNVVDILHGRLAKRGVPLNALKAGRVEPAAGGAVRQVMTLQQGIPEETAKKISRLIRDAGFNKVKAQIQGDQVRVAGKSKDELQAVIGLIKDQDLGLPLQFVNYR